MTITTVKIDKEKMNNLIRQFNEIGKGEAKHAEEVYLPYVTKTEYKNLLSKYERAEKNKEKFTDDLVFRLNEIEKNIKRENTTEVKRQLEMIRKAATKYL